MWGRIIQRPARERGFFDAHLLQSCGDCCLALVAIFALMIFHYGLSLPVNISLPLCLQKGLCLISYLVLWFQIKHRRLPESSATALAYYILFTVIGSVLYTAYLAPGHDPSIFLQVLIIGMSLILLDFQDAASHYSLVWVGWLATEHLAQHTDFPRRLATMCLFTLVGVLALRLRIRVYRQLYWLQMRDEDNNLRLASSLRESEEMRLNLDRLVSDRTQDLVVANQRHQKLQEQLWQSHKLESLGRLAGGIAHDFNNLLTIILTNLEMTLEGDLALESRDCLHDAELASQRAVELTSHLLAYSRRQVIEKTEVDLTKLLIRMRPLVQPLIGHTIVMQWQIHPEVAIVLAEAAQIHQVVMNLVVNARDAMPGGGSLRLDLDRAEGGYTISVCDEGCGIAEEDLQLIMDPFYTTKPLGQGTGLGLSIVQGIVQQFGGHVQVTSQVGHGTRVVVWLPDPCGLRQ